MNNTAPHAHTQIMKRVRSQLCILNFVHLECNIAALP